MFSLIYLDKSEKSDDAEKLKWLKLLSNLEIPSGKNWLKITPTEIEIARKRIDDAKLKLVEIEKEFQINVLILDALRPINKGNTERLQKHLEKSFPHINIDVRPLNYNALDRKITNYPSIFYIREDI